MPSRPTAKLQRVEILWEDAALDTVFDGELSSIKLPGTALNRTIGFLAYEDSHELVLVTDVTDADNSARSPYSIPKALVRERWILARQ